MERGNSGVEKTTQRGALCSVQLTQCYLADQIKKKRWTGHVACVGDGKGSYRVLVGRHDGERPHGRPRGVWENNIEMDV